MKPKTSSTVAFMMSVSLLIGGAALLLPPKVGVKVNVNHAPGCVPSAARFVSFFEPGIMGPNSAFECCIEEDAFLCWCREKGWEPCEIREPVWTARYSRFCANGDLPLEVTIADGWFVLVGYGNDGFHKVVFDRPNGKMYYHYASR